MKGSDRKIHLWSDPFILRILLSPSAGRSVPPHQISVSTRCMTGFLEEDSREIGRVIVADPTRNLRNAFGAADQQLFGMSHPQAGEIFPRCQA